MSRTVPSSSVVLTDVTFTWPEGDVALSNVSAAFSAGRTGLVGANGTGKTTLLRLITGELTPTHGNVTVNGDVAYLRQRITLDVHRTVADLLGVRETLDAVRAIEAGEVSQHNFDAVGDDWDVESRAAAMLIDAGLTPADLDRAVGTLSGGEVVLTAVAGLRRSASTITLLDEPTNNLDRPARERLYDMVRQWAGTLIVVTHDRELLELIDETAELLAGALTVFGGTYSEYAAAVAQEQAAATRAVRDAEKQLRIEKAQRIEAETKLARRKRYANTAFENKRLPKIVMNTRKAEAQVSAGKLRGEHEASVESARGAVEEAEGRVRADGHIRVDLPDPRIADGRGVGQRSDDDVGVGPHD